MTSDEFFARNRRCYDLIFIDGLHHCETVCRDICNALAALSPVPAAEVERVLFGRG